LQVQRSFAGRCLVSSSMALEPLKGIFDLIEALARVASLGQRNWILKVAGWDHEEQVKHAAQKHGVGDQVILLGHLDPTLTREEWAQLAILPLARVFFGDRGGTSLWLPVVSYEGISA